MNKKEGMSARNGNPLNGFTHEGQAK